MFKAEIDDRGRRPKTLQHFVSAYEFFRISRCPFLLRQRIPIPFCPLRADPGVLSMPDNLDARVIGSIKPRIMLRQETIN